MSEHYTVPSYDMQYLDKLDFDISIFPGKIFQCYNGSWWTNFVELRPWVRISSQPKIYFRRTSTTRQSKLPFILGQKSVSWPHVAPFHFFAMLHYTSSRSCGIKKTMKFQSNVVYYNKKYSLTAFFQVNM